MPTNDRTKDRFRAEEDALGTVEVTQVCVQVFGNDHAVAFAGSQGNFQLNVCKPVILHNVLESIQLLAEAIRSFDSRCATGIEPNEKRIREHLQGSLMLVTALNPSPLVGQGRPHKGGGGSQKTSAQRFQRGGLLATLEPRHLFEPSRVSLGTAELGGEECLCMIPGDLDAHDPSAKAEDIHVVVFDALID
jgi:hypothetical protein